MTRLNKDTILQETLVEAVFKDGRRDLYLILPIPKELDIRMLVEGDAFGDYYADAYCDDHEWPYNDQKIICVSIRVTFSNSLIKLNARRHHRQCIEGIIIKNNDLYMRIKDFSHYETVDWNALFKEDAFIERMALELSGYKECQEKLEKKIDNAKSKQKALLEFGVNK